MATYTKRGNSYRIRASVGYTVEGRQIMKSKTWTPAPGMTDRQIEKELNRQMVLFDEECRGSALTDGHIKFQVFAEQWFVEYVDKTLGKRTQHNYRQMTPRIYEAIGHLYLDKITPRQIQRFINGLGEPGASHADSGRGLSPQVHQKSPVADLLSVHLRHKDGHGQREPLPGRHAAATGDRQGKGVLHAGAGPAVP